MSDRTIYWHIPGICYFGLINHVLLDTMQKYPSKFRDGYKIASCYGTFPGAIWNGGRNIIDGFNNKTEVAKVIDSYNKKGVPVRFTWTNVLLEEKHTYDTYCNMIMKVGDNGMNQVLVNRPVLEEYIRREYPKYKIISSTTKRILDLDTLKSEIEKDYFLVVLDYDLNHNEKVIESILPEAGRIEILVNETCKAGCPKRADHYIEISRHQLEYDTNIQYPCWDPSPDKRTFAGCMKRPSFMSVDDVEKYADMGFKNFKIVGRGEGKEFLMDSYIYYLVKDDAKDFIRNQMMQTIMSLSAPKAPRMPMAPQSARAPFRR
ncbi:MAG: hypothetical protein K6G24_12390 [Lachnospiraceae bacterium]|nr:hypothetical protein [Lachnospiraceae bacterium]